MQATVWRVCLIIGVAVSAMSAQQRPARNQSTPTADLAQTLDRLNEDLVSLERSHEAYREAAEKLSTLYSELSKNVDGVGKAAAAVKAGRADASGLESLQAAIRELQQADRSLSRQYSQLQQAMQNQNRQFQTISNAMKTRHDTAKNAINNIR